MAPTRIPDKNDVTYHDLLSSISGRTLGKPYDDLLGELVREYLQLPIFELDPNALTTLTASCCVHAIRCTLRLQNEPRQCETPSGITIKPSSHAWSYLRYHYSVKRRRREVAVSGSRWMLGERDTMRAHALCVAALKLVDLHGNHGVYDVAPLHIVRQATNNQGRFSVVISYYKRLCMSVIYGLTWGRRSAIIETIESRPGLWPHTLAAIERQLISEKLAKL